MMGVLGKALLTGSLLTVIAGIGIVAIVHRSYEGPDGVQSQRFGSIATDLSRFGHTMQLIPKLFEAHVSTFLVKDGKNFILIDAGWPTRNHTQLFIAALKDATRAGTLRWILLTHGPGTQGAEAACRHMDHIGSLKEITEAFPDAQVVMHILEAPYVAGGVSHSTIPADNWAYTILHSLLPDFVKLQLPVHRILYVSGESGDMSEVKGATGQAPQWAPAKGLLEYVHMSGHAPGQIVLLHKPTASLLAADTITNLRGGFLHKTAPQLGFAPPGATSNLTQAARDAKTLAELDFSTAFPSHDHGAGVPKAALVGFVQSISP